MRTHPELVVVSRGALLNESTVVGGYVPVVGILLQHVDLQLNLLLFILDRKGGQRIKKTVKNVQNIEILQPFASIRSLSQVNNMAPLNLIERS